MALAMSIGEKQHQQQIVPFQAKIHNQVKLQNTLESVCGRIKLIIFVNLPNIA